LVFARHLPDRAHSDEITCNMRLWHSPWVKGVIDLVTTACHGNGSNFYLIEFPLSAARMTASSGIVETSATNSL